MRLFILFLLLVAVLLLLLWGCFCFCFRVACCVILVGWLILLSFGIGYVRTAPEAGFANVRPSPISVL